MDTNLNNDLKDDKDEKKNMKKARKQNKFRASAFVTILMIFIFAVVSVGSYLPTKDLLFSEKNITKTYIEGDHFNYRLARLTRYLERVVVEGNDEDPYEYANIDSIKYYISNKDKTISKSNIKDIDEVQGINEEVVNEEREISKNNIRGTIESKLEQLMNKSMFYMHIKTDDKGNIQIEQISDKKFDQYEFKNTLNSINKSLEAYANLEIIYMIPYDLKSPVNFHNYQDAFTRDIQEFYMKFYIMIIVAIGIVGVLILSIVAFCIPYERQKKISICSLYNKMPLEIKGFIWLGLVGFVGVTPLVEEFSYGIYQPFDFLHTIYYADEYFYIIGIPITFIFYLFIYLSIVYIKYIYHTGFKKGLIENSIVGKIYFYITIEMKKMFKEMIELDTKKSINKKIGVVLGFIAWMVILFGPWGFALGAFCVMFLYHCFSNLRIKVKALNDATSKLAKGDFNIDFEEDMGIFTSICENLNNIKDGFKVAIDEEIKSQQMKTELISNVSHDLKTPLTSIITYVDLLKKEAIQNETQKEYIDVLDRKAKRLKVLIEDLFEASKASSGNIDLHLEKVDVIALFRQTLGELEEKINQSTLQMKMNLPENKVICQLDGRRTYRVFENIMSNILKYAMPHSRVYIDALEDEKEISFTFKNISGYEMNFDISQITERFTRGDKSRNTEGSGLGLAITKSLIELQKGSLNITIDGDLFKVIVTFPKGE
ncbi:MAG: HAMP domain-containing histidine kinase [Marinisporobacter sp.]|nr:HAMP domain-containing histidine kinase [Marinisporobacter sp.]